MGQEKSPENRGPSASLIWPPQSQIDAPDKIKNDNPPCITGDSDGQEVQLSPQRRLKVARLVQDLASFYYEQTLVVINEPDPIFTKPFSRFALCVRIVEELLKGVSE